jgi:hypothetical protein
MTSSSVTSDLAQMNIHRIHANIPSSSSMYYSSYSAPYHDETIIPILCTSDQYRTSTPVKMRILVKRSTACDQSKMNPIHSNMYTQAIRRPYHHKLSSPSSLYHSSLKSSPHVYQDSYRLMPSYWRTRGPRSSSLYHRKKMDDRLLSQRLWDIDSADEDNDTILVNNDRTLLQQPLHDFHSNYLGQNEQILAYIDDENNDEFYLQ